MGEIPSDASPLVQEGWRHLQLQRPLAAWASWQRALRLDPDDAPAKQAIEALENAEEWPASARAAYRFLTPRDDATRARWDARFRGRDLAALDAAAEAFGALTADDPNDVDAWLNLALCQAWLGRNVEAVAGLDRVVMLSAANDPERARDAWTLAEVLRQGGGAEALADDFRYAWIVDAGRDPAAFDALFRAWPNLVPLEMPGGAARVEDGQVFDWLDRPPLEPGTLPERALELPRVLATVIRTPSLLRISSPELSGFAPLEDLAETPAGRVLLESRKEKAPLPIPWADSALGTFRFPQGLPEDEKAGLARTAVEHYYENHWIHQPRTALGGGSPLAASGGDAAARARLAGVVRYREQLGTRPTHAAVYQGYPFDRLRRRLGLLTPGESGSIDAEDVSCMSPGELDALDPETLDAHRLADAFVSAAGLSDDARTARFAGPLVRLGPSAVGRLDPAAIVAPLVREAMRLGDPDAALDWLKLAENLGAGPELRVFRVWAAEIHARTGEPEEALRIYQRLLEASDPSAGAALALDGAETLLDRGHPDEALTLLIEARDRARLAGDAETLRKAETLLGRLDGAS